MLGYNTFGYKLLALCISGALSGISGAAYALLFAYVGATFASTQYSIYPLLWVLLGGAGTALGPLIGTGLMFYLVEFASEITSSYLIVVGVVLVLLVIVFPKGLIGTVSERWRGLRS
jgi:branched-chain amino acid transport system permease protein